MAPTYDQTTKGSVLIKDFAENIKGKVILVTGCSPGGIGALYVTAIAPASPAVIILAGRTTESIAPTEKAVQEANPAVKTKLLAVDLASFKSVRRAAEEVNSWEDVPHIDLLVNNAGIMACPYGVTEDGFEKQFGTNHLGHFLFTNLIMDKILKSKTPRVVSVSSGGHRFNPIRWGDYNFSVRIFQGQRAAANDDLPLSSFVPKLIMLIFYSFRTAKLTTYGRRMDSPRPRTTSSPSPWLPSWHGEVCKPTRFAPVPTVPILRETWTSVPLVTRFPR